jgi:hypothetical protein
LDPSQHNTFTGKLTPSMLEAVLRRAIELADSAPPFAVLGEKPRGRLRSPG